LLAEVLPLGRPLHATAVRLHTQAVAQRLEDELGAEHTMFINGCPRDWRNLPRPDLPLVVGLDGGYVHSAHQRSRRDGWFEVIAGKSMPADGQAKSFGFVQTYDAKPKRRLLEALKGQGMQANQQVTFVTDGGEDVRDLPLYLNPGSEHLLDWFRVTMRITVMANMAKSLRAPPPDPDLPSAPPMDLAAEVAKQLERLKWFLWHGNVFGALQVISDLIFDLDIEQPDLSHARLLRTASEFDTYIRANADSIPNYGEGYRAGEVISSSFVESAINQVSASAWSNASRCAGLPAARTYCSRSAPGSSTTTSPTTSTAGIPASPMPNLTERTWPRPRSLRRPLEGCWADVRVGCTPTPRASHGFPALPYWNDLRTLGDRDSARRFKDARRSLLKKPDNLTDQQAQTLKRLKAAGGEVWRAYTLKEALRAIFAPGLTVADVAMLIDRFISKAARSRLEPFVKLGRTIRQHRDGILQAIRLGINPGRTEALNNKVRLITRRAYGFHSAKAALALVMLTCGPITLTPPHELHE